MVEIAQPEWNQNGWCGFGPFFWRFRASRRVAPACRGARRLFFRL